MYSTRTVRYLEVFLLAILVVVGFTAACGPGRRRESSSRKMRKMTPLVYKQHVPNVSENTIGASGQPDGAIKRGDPRFKDLVENHDINVIFRDEERDGSDRIMSKRCKEKLEILADLVQNQWPGKTPEDQPVKVKVKEAWDDNYLHGIASLHYEGRAVDVSTNDRDRSKLGVLARLAVNAGFDWVFYESHGHIHCSVKSDSSAAIKRGGCFTGNSVVHVESLGHIPMSDLRIGDRVMSMRSDGEMEYSEVITFMDRDDNGYGLFYKIQTESGKQLTLTGKHLVYVLDEASTLNFENYDIVFADTVAEGQYLLLKDKDTVIATAVTSVTVETRKGIYAPLTKHGTIVVDDFIASCYAYIDNVFIAHAVFAPMRIYHDISQYIPAHSWISSENTVQNNRNSTDLPIGMHWYASLLYEVGTRILSRELLHLH